MLFQNVPVEHLVVVAGGNSHAESQPLSISGRVLYLIMPVHNSISLYFNIEYVDSCGVQCNCGR